MPTNNHTYIYIDKYIYIRICLCLCRCLLDVDVYVYIGGNPPGYGSAHLASVGRLFVDVDMGGLVKSLGHRPALGLDWWFEWLFNNQKYGYKWIQLINDGWWWVRGLYQPGWIGGLSHSMNEVSRSGSNQYNSWNDVAGFPTVHMDISWFFSVLDGGSHVPGSRWTRFTSRMWMWSTSARCRPPTWRTGWSPLERSKRSKRSRLEDVGVRRVGRVYGDWTPKLSNYFGKMMIECWIWR
jgi:hypothetical protein